MRALLLTVPISDPTQPSLAVPALAAALRQRGVHVSVRDLGIEMFDRVTSRPYLVRALARCKDLARSAGVAKGRDFLVASAILTGEPTIDRVETAKAELRNADTFYDFRRYKQAVATINQALVLASAAAYPTRATFTQYLIEGDETEATVLAHLADEDRNLFLAPFREVLPELIQERPDVIGLSITYGSQFVPGLTLARCLREAMPQVPLILGGAYLTAIAGRLPLTRGIWDLCSGIVLYEGETAMAEICARVSAGQPLSGSANLLTPDHVPSPSELHVEDIEALPTPDYAGLPLDRYLTPGPVLSIQSCRGCYWGRCAFCSISRATRTRYRQRSTERVCADLEALHARHGASTFFLADDATRPDVMLQLADYVRLGNRPFAWATEARFEKRLDDSTCARLHAGGCRHLIFGFESGSQQVLRLMAKGTHLPAVKQVLAACRSAGIGVNLQAFIGFPGETAEQAKATETYFRANRWAYTSLGLGNFVAVEGCQVVNEPERFGVKVEWDSQKFLVPWLAIQTTTGMPRAEVETRFREMMAGLQFDDLMGPGLLNGSSGAHGLLYLQRFGRELVDQLGGEPNRWVGDIDREMFRLNPEITISPLDGDSSTWLAWHRSGAPAATISKVAAEALRRFEPATTITNAVAPVTGEETLEDLEALSTCIGTLINMARSGILVRENAAATRT